MDSSCFFYTQLALSFPGIISTPHFNRIAFKVINKRIFATLHHQSATANIKFSPKDQSVFALINKESNYPVNNKWGLQGWTTFQLELTGMPLIQEALHTAYEEVMKGVGRIK